MHRQINGLAATIIQEYDMNVYDDALFLFCGGKKTALKPYIGKETDLS